MPTIQRFVSFFIAITHSSLGHGIHFEIPLWRNTEGIRHSIEESKHRGYIHSLCDLWLAPTMMAENLYVFHRCSIRRLSHLGDIIEKRSLGWRDPRVIELSFCNRLHRFVVCSLNPQEVCM
jgi:hypothetical protein